MQARTAEECLSRLSAAEQRALAFDWQFWARDDQLPPLHTAAGKPWTTWLVLGGRGAGKTRAGAEWVRAMALGLPPIASAPARRIALVGESLGDVRSVMVDGESGLLAIHPPKERPIFKATLRQLVWPNGSIAQLFSADTPDSLRGPQFHAAWCDELAKWRYAEEAFDMLQFALRLGQAPRQVITTTPRPTPLIKRLMADETTAISRARTAANAANLAPAFLQTIVARYQGTALGRQELDGELVEDRADALWQRGTIERHRLAEAPPLARIVVAVDPPMSSGTRSDACGIVVAGVVAGEAAADGGRPRACVLADRTVQRAQPLVWARAAVAAFHEFQADALVAEVNQGGELVETVIRQIDPEIAVRKVRATRGKWLRAEPVSALYTQGRVAHVGRHAALEDQMCQLAADGRVGGRSPDRVDALVWAITELLLKAGGRPGVRRI